ncbi:MAG TPA: phenylalanine--tRNA ligase subunit alpha [Myxococcales bacterium]|nr:phenylalanine--tRNA ligase subunit alpha [Myxococcales bacterium]HAN31346.1 phenylalanine--tRNA ligase subunit alpha [Myxococcales bacterium]
MSSDTAPSWQADIDRLSEQLSEAISGADDLEALRAVELAALGRKGSLTALMKRIGTLDKDERKAFGSASGGLRGRVTKSLNERRETIRRQGVLAELSDSSFDETVPGRSSELGHVHPLNRVQMEAEDVFVSMGFEVLDYPEVESEFNNFEALNIPSWHPARDMQDTFWLESGQLLRTHTSAGQVRAMHALKAPFRAIFPGKVYRYEATDASHEHTFHQLEGLMIDRHVSVGHLLDSMRTLLSAILRREVTVRLRPGYFPFVEPGFELDISCQVCEGTGCSVCKQSGWVELLPCGLVHPNVLRAGGLDPEHWQGWAFGLGLSRLVMMRYGIDDIRLLLGGDARFVEGFHPGT